MADKPFMYTDLSERQLLGWQLDYTMDRVIRTFESIPADVLYARPRPNINAPAWIFAHIVAAEQGHVGACCQGVEATPDRLKGLHRKAHLPPGELAAALGPRAALVAAWREVRQRTHAYLDRIADADLKRVPAKTLLPDGDPNRDNPVREWFVMTILHQNLHHGELHIIAKLIEADRLQA
jgi:hypothetical protein